MKQTSMMMAFKTITLIKGNEGHNQVNWAGKLASDLKEFSLDCWKKYTCFQTGYWWQNWWKWLW